MGQWRRPPFMTIEFLTKAVLDRVLVIGDDDFNGWAKANTSSSFRAPEHYFGGRPNSFRKGKIGSIVDITFISDTLAKSYLLNGAQY